MGLSPEGVGFRGNESRRPLELGQCYLRYGLGQLCGRMFGLSRGIATKGTEFTEWGGEDNSKSAMPFAFVDEVVELSLIEVELYCLVQGHSPMVQVRLLAKHSACVMFLGAEHRVYLYGFFKQVWFTGSDVKPTRRASERTTHTGAAGAARVRCGWRAGAVTAGRAMPRIQDGRALSGDCRVRRGDAAVEAGYGVCAELSGRGLTGCAGSALNA